MLWQHIPLDVIRPKLVDQKLTCRLVDQRRPRRRLPPPERSADQGQVEKLSRQTEERRDVDDQARVDPGQIHEGAGDRGHGQRVVPRSLEDLDLSTQGPVVGLDAVISGLDRARRLSP